MLLEEAILHLSFCQNIALGNKTCNKLFMKKRNIINRRDFILQSALLSTGSLLTFKGMASIPTTKYKMGLQLFTVRGPLARDVSGTVKKIASVGYEDCETYGYDPQESKFYGLKASEFKQLLEDNGMITTSGHYDFTKFFDKPADDLMRYVDQCVEGAQALNQRYITWPWLDPAFRTLDHFKQLTEKLNSIGERVNKANLGFAYHHHDFEFIDYGGQNGYDIIMHETDPALVKLQMDLYWVIHPNLVPLS
jgi:sugar phosphate isomerase/epimerase